MFDFDWDGDSKETIFDDILTAHIVFGDEDEEKDKSLFDSYDKDFI